MAFWGTSQPLTGFHRSFSAVGDQTLGVEHVDRSNLGPDRGRVHVRVMTRGGHHRRALVAQHGRDHKALALADPGHSDRQDVVLGLGEQPGAGGDVHSERQRLPRGCGILAVEGGGVPLDCCPTHPALDVGPAGLCRPAVLAPRPSPEEADQPDSHDEKPDNDQMRDDQRGPQGGRSGQGGPVGRAPRQSRVGQMPPEPEEDAGSCAYPSGHEPMSAEDQGGHLTPGSTANPSATTNVSAHKSTMNGPSKGV